MNLDIKREAAKIVREICTGSVEQAIDDYKNILGNCHFITSAPLEKSFLINFGIQLSKHVRKNPEHFLLFCEKIWYDSIEDGKEPIGPILAALELINPEVVIPAIISFCKDAEGIEDVDVLVTGFEPVIVREPFRYFPALEAFLQDENIWVKRLMIVTVGKIMYRHKKSDITLKCLELLRPTINHASEHLRKVTSWTIGCFGIRSDQQAIASFVQTFADTDNPHIVWNFSEALKRSRITIQQDVCTSLIPVFEKWSSSTNADVRKNAECALRILHQEV